MDYGNARLLRLPGVDVDDAVVGESLLHRVDLDLLLLLRLRRLLRMRKQPVNCDAVGVSGVCGTSQRLLQQQVLPDVRLYF